MPLSDPGVRRQHYHTRAIEVQGFFREDGLWDIEGHMRDTKTYTFNNHDRGDIHAGEPIHDMLLRITIDDTMLIVGAEASTESSPYSICGEIAPAYEKLIGLRIGAGFHREVKKRLGRDSGCTHLTELLYPMATVCYQTAYASRRKAREDFGLPPDPPQDKTDQKPGHLDSCHAMRLDGPVVQKAWPQFYTGDQSGE